MLKHYTLWLMPFQTLDVYEFPEDVVSRNGNYLNDLVLDPSTGFAYISDSGYGPTGFFGGIIGRK